jgi:hypothetical protein
VPSRRRPQQVRLDAICDGSACSAARRSARRSWGAAALGVSEFNIYPYIPNLLETIDLYGRTIAPGINAAAPVKP